MDDGSRGLIKRDGKDYPYAFRGQQAEITVAYKTVEANLAEVTIKADGKIAFTGTETVSPDGKTFIWSTKRTNEQGQPITIVEVYDRLQ